MLPARCSARHLARHIARSGRQPGTERGRGEAEWRKNLTEGEGVERLAGNRLDEEAEQDRVQVAVDGPGTGPAAEFLTVEQLHRFPAFTGDTPIAILGATILPQSLWVLAGAVAVFIGLWLFFTRTLTGRAVLATSNNRLAAQLVGINTGWVMTLSFALSAAIGALAGVLVTPITNTSYDVGIALALKGFAAAMLGGMGNPKGALVGGILLGLIEALTAGYISSTYKDAAAFVVILAVLFLMPQGIFGAKSTDRV